jgi:hypothetical protein
MAATLHAGQTPSRQPRHSARVGTAASIRASTDGHDRASSEKVALARPTGVGRGITTYEIPIEGRDEWLAAAGQLA